MTDTKSLANALAAAVKAPTITFDEAPMVGIKDRVGHIVLTLQVHDDGPHEQLRHRSVTMAQLQGNAEAFASLRDAIDGLEAAFAGSIPLQKTN